MDCCRTPGRGASQTEGDYVELRRYSLRFEVPAAEAGFARSLSGKLAKSVMVMSVSSMVCYSIFLCVSAAFSCWNAECHESYDDFNVFMACRAVDFASVASMLLVGLVMGAQQRWRMMSDFAVEILTLTMCCVVVIAAPLTEKHVMALVMGIATNEPLDDAWLLLFTNCVITGSHMLLPMRWCTLWPLEVVAIVVYPIISIWSAREYPLDKVLTLLLLVLLSASGKRQAEVREREAFRNVLNERTLRALSEFELEQHRDRANASRQDSAREEGSASLRSGGTGVIFEQPISAKNAQSALEQLESIGRQEHWLLDTDDLRIAPQRALGGGSFGVVVEGSLRGLAVAVKMSRQRFGDGRADRVPAAMTEVRVLRQVKHPNVAMFYGAIVDNLLSEVAVVLELVAGVSLAVFIRGKDLTIRQRCNVSEADRYAVLLGISSALQHLHSHRPAIVHGDLKPTNVLVEPHGVGGRSRACAKLVDFGLSRVLKGRTRPLGGSLPWVAPELVPEEGQRAPYPSVGTDIFSFGRIIFFVAMGIGPFEGESLGSIRKLLRAGDVHAPDCDEQASLFEESCYDVGIVCVDPDPTERPGIAEVYDQIRVLQRMPELREALADSGTRAACGPADPRELLSWSRGVITVREAQQKREHLVSDKPSLSWQSLVTKGTSFSSSRHSHLGTPRLPTLAEEGAPTTPKSLWDELADGLPHTQPAGAPGGGMSL